MKQVKRKQLIVDRIFQFRFISSFLFSILISMLVFSVFVGAYFWISDMAGENLFKEFITIDRQVVQNVEVEINGRKKIEKQEVTKTETGVKRWEIVLPPLLLNNLIIMVAVSIIGVLYTHRIAGPAYRMQIDIRRVLDGEKGVRISLRKKDRLQALAASVNELITEYDKNRKIPDPFADY